MTQTVQRYLRIFAAQFRTSLLLGMQYRVDFLVSGVFSLLSIAVMILPFIVVYGQRESIAGWSFAEALTVVAFFTLLKALLSGAINPSLLAVVEHIRKGTLDFILIKPADAQFLVSTTRFEPWRLIEVFGAIAIAAVAFDQMGRVPTLGQLFAALVMVLAGTTVLYSLLILVLSLSFYVVRVDNLTFFFSAIFDASRWPVNIFPGILRLVFTFILPLAVMTTFPAMALLGTLTPHAVLSSLVGAFAFLVLSRLAWRGAIRQYTSASS